MQALNEVLHSIITRNLIKFMSAFTQFNLEGCGRIAAFERRKKSSTSSTENQEPLNSRIPLWPKAIFCLYIYVNIKLGITFYWQLNYDCESYKLTQVRASIERLTPNGGLRNTTGCEADQMRALANLEDQHLLELEMSWKRLKNLGQPLIELQWSFAPSLALSLYVTALVYSQYIVAVSLGIMKPFDLNLVRITLSPEYEMLECKREIKAEAMKLLSSSKNFVLNEISRSQEYVNVANSARISLATSAISTGSGIQAQIQNHLDAYDHLKEFIASGELLPINRSSEWTDKASQQFALIASSNLVYSFVFDFSLLYVIPVYLNKLKFDSYKDWITYVELWIIFEINVMATTLHVTLQTVNATDQQRYIEWLSKRFQSSIIDSDKQVFAVRESSEICRLKIKAANRNFSRVIMEYEIFIAQFRQIQRSFSYIALINILVALGVPTIMRLYMPYATKHHHSFAIYFYIVVVIFTDSMLIPIAKISHTSSLLYKSMFSQLCQMIEFNDILRSCPETNGMCCDEHLIWRLRSVLGDTHKFTDQFSAKPLPHLQITWPNLIRMHYWYVLMMITHYIKIDSWRTLIGDRLDDPLLLHAELSSLHLSNV